jgi:hypothetical protein
MMAAPAGIDGAEPEPTFSLTEGGPGSALLKRIHLVHPQFGTGLARTALVLMALTWPLC